MIKRYLTISGIIIFLDIITKKYALGLKEPLYINSYLEFVLDFNRGISWGFFSSSDVKLFGLITGLVILVTCFLAIYTYMQYINKRNIIPEILVLSGSFSNIIDRFQYGAVIDFISIHVLDYYWPTFNIADISIVVGIFLMAYYLKE